MTEPKRVLISGAGFHNKGAEAMLLAVCGFLQRRSQAAELYAHCADDYSAGRLREAGVHPVDLRPRVPRLLRPVQMLGLCAGLGAGTAAKLLPAEVREPAAVLDVSGFAYSDQWGGGVARYAWQLYDAVQGPETRLFFLPQGWGPFTGFRIRFTMRRLLRRAALVCPRDRVSHEALAGLGGVAEDRILPAPDIAFHFTGQPPEVGRSILTEAGVPVGERPVMAVTPNIRAFERAASSSDRDNEYLDFLAEAAEQTLAGSDCSVVLLAHESDLTGGSMDDRVLCRRLQQQTGPAGPRVLPGRPLHRGRDEVRHRPGRLPPRLALPLDRGGALAPRAGRGRRLVAQVWRADGQRRAGRLRRRRPLVRQARCVGTGRRRVGRSRRERGDAPPHRARPGGGEPPCPRDCCPVHCR